jgi:hypothetical protein
MSVEGPSVLWVQVHLEIPDLGNRIVELFLRESLDLVQYILQVSF